MRPHRRIIREGMPLPITILHCADEVEVRRCVGEDPILEPALAVYFEVMELAPLSLHRRAPKACRLKIGYKWFVSTRLCLRYNIF